jgi:hypothetical protein
MRRKLPVLASFLLAATMTLSMGFVQPASAGGNIILRHLGVLPDGNGNLVTIMVTETQKPSGVVIITANANQVPNDTGQTVIWTGGSTGVPVTSAINGRSSLDWVATISANGHLKFTAYVP